MRPASVWTQHKEAQVAQVLTKHAFTFCNAHCQLSSTTNMLLSFQLTKEPNEATLHRECPFKQHTRTHALLTWLSLIAFSGLHLFLVLVNYAFCCRYPGSLPLCFFTGACDSIFVLSQNAFMCLWALNPTCERSICLSVCRLKFFIC